jgi:5-methyltetrahydropteroyltriglutamate--homocysteine methyltransferase
MTALLFEVSKSLPVERIRVNPDCGLKTRKSEEVRSALVNIVQAAKDARATIL